MRFLFLSELYYPHGGGAEYATHLIARRLSGAGHEIRVVTNRFKDELEYESDNGVTFIRKKLITSEHSVKYSLLLNRGVLNTKWMQENLEWADIIYIPRYWYNAIPGIKKLGKPVIVHLHDYIAVCTVANLFDVKSSKTCSRKSCSYSCIYRFERFRGKSMAFSALSSLVNTTIGGYMGNAIRKSDAIICVSHAQKSLITGLVPDLEEKICVVPNPLPELSHVEIEAKGLAYFGGSSPFKGYHTLIGSLGLVTSPDTRFIFTGFRDLDTLKHRDPRASYMGWIKGEELEQVYRAVHTVIIPSIIPEPAPYVVYEAILRGRLVVASDIGGIPEQLEGYEGCYLFQPGDSKQLAKLVDEAMSYDLDEVRKIGRMNRERLLKKGQNSKMLDAFQELARRVN